jgi:gelsolin
MEKKPVNKKEKKGKKVAKQKNKKEEKKNKGSQLARNATNFNFDRPVATPAVPSAGPGKQPPGGAAQSLGQKIRAEAAKSDPAWQQAGHAPGLQIWRIEKFTVQPVDPASYGAFFSGDSYIVLRTYQRPGGSALGWDVHFWLGTETSQDEAGTAAYKTVELDDLLGGAPVQHREVQGFESELFLTYFPAGIRIMDGGIESGFRRVGPKEYRPRLMHLKGTVKGVRCQEVELSAYSLNSGDVFLLDKGDQLYLWNGSGANPHEKRKGGELATAIRNERGGKATINSCDEGTADANAFYALLGGDSDCVLSAAEAGEDQQAQPMQKTLKISDASGQINMVVVSENQVAKKFLNSNDAFLCDVGSEVFCWVGKGASPQEKKLALQFAQDYLVRFNRPAYTPISRVFEGSENEVFLSFVH